MREYQEVFVGSTDERVTLVVSEGRCKPCEDCGYPFTQPAGACSLCPECGTSTGCS